MRLALKRTMSVCGSRHYKARLSADIRVASQNDLPGTNLTLRQLFIVVGGVATVVTIINCGLTFLSHFLWRSNYREQKQ